MPAPTTLPLLRRLARWLVYSLFQLALLAAHTLQAIGTLRLPLRFGTADESGAARLAAGQPVRPRFSTHVPA